VEVLQLCNINAFKWNPVNILQFFPFKWNRPLLTGTRKEPSERILGMLPSLKVSIHISEDTDDSKWSVHTLSNVLVVDALPVPLHVSLKTIRVFPEDQSGMLEATSFPPQYQSHPYWNEQLRKEILYAGVNF
jgi:hypothetical protein